MTIKENGMEEIGANYGIPIHKKEWHSLFIVRFKTRESIDGIQKEIQYYDNEIEALFCKNETGRIIGYNITISNITQSSHKKYAP